MTNLSLSTGAPAAPGLHRLVWLLLIVFAIVLSAVPALAPWAVDYPKAWIVPLAREISAFSKLFIEYFSWLTRGISAGLEVPFRLAVGVLAKGFEIGRGEEAYTIPRLSWLGILTVVTMIGYAYGGRRTALVGFVCFFYLAL